jgi:hypothetical protein
MQTQKFDRNGSGAKGSGATADLRYEKAVKAGAAGGRP